MQSTQATPLFQRVCSLAALRSAAVYLCRTDGSPGVDGQTAGSFRVDEPRLVGEIRRELRDGKYQLRPFRKARIPKDKGGFRTIGVPCFRDRIVGRAIVGVLSDLLEPHWHDSSHGYRPSRSISTAALRVIEAVDAGMAYAASLDIQSFFDSIDHDLLMSRFSQIVPDTPLLELIGQLIRNQRWSTDSAPAFEKGVCQGMPLSPISANLLLHPLDVALARCTPSVRYADDVLILCRSAREARYALRKARAFLKDELQLDCSEDKCSVACVADGFDYLGLHFCEGHITLTGHARRRLLDLIEQIIAESRDCAELVIRSRSTVHSWANAYCAAEGGQEMHSLAGAVAQRLFDRFTRLARGCHDEYVRHWRWQSRQTNVEKAHTLARGRFLRRELLA